MKKSIATKIKVMELLEQNGIDSEEKLTKLDTRRILAFKNVTIPIISMIVDIQEAVKENRLFGYLLEQPQAEIIQNQNSNESESYTE